MGNLITHILVYTYLYACIWPILLYSIFNKKQIISLLIVKIICRVYKRYFWWVGTKLFPERTIKKNPSVLCLIIFFFNLTTIFSLNFEHLFARKLNYIQKRMGLSLWTLFCSILFKLRQLLLVTLRLNAGT